MSKDNYLIEYLTLEQCAAANQLKAFTKKELFDAHYLSFVNRTFIWYWSNNPPFPEQYRQLICTDLDKLASYWGLSVPTYEEQRMHTLKQKKSL